MLPEPGLAPDARRPWSRPAQRPPPPAPPAAAPPPPPPAPSVQPVLPMPGAPPFLFVVDASNVALRHGNKETFSCRGVEICLDYLGRRFPGARVALFARLLVGREEGRREEEARWQARGNAGRRGLPAGPPEARRPLRHAVAGL